MNMHVSILFKYYDFKFNILFVVGNMYAKRIIIK